jgi:hypothetical protein
VLADNGKHLPCFKILEAVPAEVLIRPFLAIFSIGKEALLHRLLFPIGFQFLGDFLLIQALEKKQVGDLLDHFKRVGNTTRPERIPDPVNLTANLTGKHRFFRGRITMLPQIPVGCTIVQNSLQKANRRACQQQSPISAHSCTARQCCQNWG